MNSKRRKNIQSLIIAMIEKKISFEIKVSYQEIEYVSVLFAGTSVDLFARKMDCFKSFDRKLERVSNTVRDLDEGETNVFCKDVFKELAELIAKQQKGVFSNLTVSTERASLFITTKDFMNDANNYLIESELIKYDDTAKASLQKIKVLYNICRERLRKEVTDDNE